MPEIHYTEPEAARALNSIIGDSTWLAVCIAHGMSALEAGGTAEEAARAICRHAEAESGALTILILDIS